MDIGARGGDAPRSLAEDGPVPPDFLRSAAGEQTERLASRVEAQEAARLGARRRRRPVFQGMAHERRRDTTLAKERFFERQDHRESIHRRELAHAFRTPGPHLRRDVIQDGNSGGGGRSGGTEVIARIVDENNEVVAFF